LKVPIDLSFWRFTSDFFGEALGENVYHIDAVPYRVQRGPLIEFLYHCWRLLDNFESHQAGVSQLQYHSEVLVRILFEKQSYNNIRGNEVFSDVADLS